MYTKWTSHLKDDYSKAQFELDIRRAKPVLDRLKDLVDQDMEGANRRNTDFSSPSWPYVQAYTIGLQNALETIKQLVDLDKQKDIDER